MEEKSDDLFDIKKSGQPRLRQRLERQLRAGLSSDFSTRDNMDDTTRSGWKSSLLTEVKTEGQGTPGPSRPDSGMASAQRKSSPMPQKKVTFTSHCKVAQITEEGGLRRLGSTVLKYADSMWELADPQGAGAGRGQGSSKQDPPPALANVSWPEMDVGQRPGSARAASRCKPLEQEWEMEASPRPTSCVPLSSSPSLPAWLRKGEEDKKAPETPPPTPTSPAPTWLLMWSKEQAEAEHHQGQKTGQTAGAVQDCGASGSLVVDSKAKTAVYSRPPTPYHPACQGEAKAATVPPAETAAVEQGHKSPASTPATPTPTPTPLGLGPPTPLPLPALT